MSIGFCKFLLHQFSFLLHLLSVFSALFIVISLASLRVRVGFQILIVNVKSLFLEQDNQKVSRNDSNDVSVFVQHGECMVRCFQCQSNICNSINSLQGKYSVSHQLQSSDLYTRIRDPILQDGHLLASDSPVVQTSCEIGTYGVGNHDSEEHRHKQINHLRSFHNNHCKRVSHASVACKH